LFLTIVNPNLFCMFYLVDPLASVPGPAMTFIIWNWVLICSYLKNFVCFDTLSFVIRWCESSSMMMKPETTFYYLKKFHWIQI